jgi:hypothetical protein
MFMPLQHSEAEIYANLSNFQLYLPKITIFSETIRVQKERIFGRRIGDFVAGPDSGRDFPPGGFDPIIHNLVVG